MLGPRLSIVSSLESLQIVEKHSVVINLIVLGYQTSGTTDNRPFGAQCPGWRLNGSEAQVALLCF